MMIVVPNRQQFKLIEEEIDRNENDGGNRRSVKR